MWGDSANLLSSDVRRECGINVGQRRGEIMHNYGLASDIARDCRFVPKWIGPYGFVPKFFGPYGFGPNGFGPKDLDPMCTDLVDLDPMNLDLID